MNTIKIRLLNKDTETREKEDRKNWLLNILFNLYREWVYRERTIGEPFNVLESI